MKALDFGNIKLGKPCPKGSFQLLNGFTNDSCGAIFDANISE